MHDQTIASNGPVNGDLFPLQTAFSLYLKRWYDSIYADTKAVKEFTERGFPHCCQWAPGRMVDDAQAILDSYRKNDNAPQGKNTPLPFVACAMAKDYTPLTADRAGKQMSRKLVSLEPNGSVYGYRQAMHSTRVQVVIYAADKDSARSLAAQFCLFIGDYANRRFTAFHRFGQYTAEMPVVLETPDTLFMNIDTGQKNLTVLAADLALEAQIPYFDFPKAGEPNDGSGRNPPGYPAILHVEIVDGVTNAEGSVTNDGINFH